MTEFLYNFDMVHRITASAVGPPGQRVFYVQARQGTHLLSLVAEKEQVRALADAINQMLDDLAEKNPRLSTSDDLLIADMDLEEPIEPEFRIAQMGLGYDEDRDMIVLVVQAINEEDPEMAAELGDEAASLARIAATRAQMRALSEHAQRVVEAGRPICGNCGQPMEAGGHFCPERNGHGPIMIEQ